MTTTNTDSNASLRLTQLYKERFELTGPHDAGYAFDVLFMHYFLTPSDDERYDAIDAEIRGLLGPLPPEERETMIGDALVDLGLMRDVDPADADAGARSLDVADAEGSQPDATDVDIESTPRGGRGRP